MKGKRARSHASVRLLHATANLPTNIVDFRGFDSSIILMFKGWNSQAHRGFARKFESSNVSRDNASREIGRMFLLTRT